MQGKEAKVTVGEGGKIVIPQEIMEAARLKDGDAVVVSADLLGRITVRQWFPYPIREYTDEDIEMFEKENSVPPEIAAKVEGFLRERQG